METTRLKLEPSESAALAAASRIYAAYVAAGAVTPENADEIMDSAIDSAIRMAKKVDRLVRSDGEVS